MSKTDEPAQNEHMSHKLTIIASCLALCIVQIGCNRTAPPAARKPPARNASPVAKVPVVTVQEKAVKEVITVPATVEGYERAHLMAKIDAYVKTVHVNIGDEVAAGELLIDLDVPELEFAQQKAERMVEQTVADQAVRNAELRAAEAKIQEHQALVALRRSEHVRIEKLVSRGALKPQKLEEAQFALASAEAEMASMAESLVVAQSRLEMAAKQIEVATAEVGEAKALAGYRQINAPFAGVITRRSVDPGAFVRPATAGGSTKPMLTIARVDKLRAVVYLTMDQAVKLSDGDAVTFSAVDVPGREFTGTVSRHAKAYDEGTRMMRAEVDLDNPPDATTNRRPLRPGGYGTLTITVDAQDLPAVPKTALFEERGNNYVVVVDRHGTCRRTPVAVAVEGDRWVGVGRGIAPDERVVAEKPQKIADKKRLAANEIGTWQ